MTTTRGQPRPETTLALVLGASRWPFIRRFGEAPSFQNSAYQMTEWINDEKGLSLPSRNIKDLFGSRDDAAEILAEAARFVSYHRAESEDNSNIIKDLIIYYAGHGDFHDGEFFLTVRRTTEDDPLISSITAKTLGNWIRRVAKGLRTYLILDCCFASSIQQGFMGGALSAADIQLQNALPSDIELGTREGYNFPKFGVALLAAAGPGQPARAPGGLDLTMFTGELLATLRSGDLNLPNTLSLSDLHYLVSSRIKQRFGADGATPELRPLQQRDGRVDLVGLFPNSAYSSQRARDEGPERPRQDTGSRQRDIAEREAAERAEREAAERAEREAAERAKREAAERAEREAAERAEREAAERAKREAAERAKREAAERAERKAAERAEREAGAAAARREAQEKRRARARIHWLSIIIVLMVLAAGGSLAFWQARLSIVNALAHHGSGEPTSLLEEASLWPTIGLRVLGTGLCIWLICFSLRSLEDNKERIYTEMGLPAPLRRLLLEEWKELELRGQPARVRLTRIFSLFWPNDQLFLPNDWPSRTGERPRLRFVELETGFAGTRVAGCARASLATWGLLFISETILTTIWGQLNVPLRAVLVGRVYTTVTLVDVFVTIFLTFLVADANFFSRSFIKRLTAVTTVWPDETVYKFQMMFGLGAAYLTDWIDMQLLAKRTSSITYLIYFPFLALAV